MPYFGKDFFYSGMIEEIYTQANKLKINPNLLLNDKCIEIIKRGLGKKMS